jgi:integrase/recombinase XerD
MQEGDASNDLSVGDFAIPKSDAKNVIPRLIRILVIATRKNKLDYGTLRYIHRQVIKRAKLTIPRPPKKLYDLPTSDELDRFFSAIDDSQIKLLFMVIHNCGLRVSEACSIKVSKIDFQNSTMLITGKGNKDRIIPLSPKIVERIKLFLSGRKHQYLFETKLGTPYSPRRIEQLCQEIKTKAEITKKLTPHTFRHYYFSKMAELGVDVDIRAMIAGHSSTRTQEIYSHVGLSGAKSMILEVLEKMEASKILK